MPSRASMAKSMIPHTERRLSDEERARHAQIRAGGREGFPAGAAKDFPPKAAAERLPAPPGIPAQVRQAREARGFTWYALAQAAGIVNQATIRDIEQGKDVKLSDVQAVAAALGLKLELVEEVV